MTNHRVMQQNNLNIKVVVHDPMKITICGSMSFAKEMSEIKEILTKKGHQVTCPAELHLHLDPNNKINNRQEKIELDVIRKYFEEIKATDAVLVLNYDKNNIKNYIGGNSFLEMAFAHVLNKKIFLMNEIPQMGYSDEIEAMQPIVLNKNWTKISGSS